MLKNVRSKKQTVYRILKKGLPLLVLVVLFLGRTSFFSFNIDFCKVAVRKFDISGVYWL